VRRFVSVGRNDIVVSVADRQGRPLSAVSVALKFASSSTNLYDREYSMERVRDGAFHASVDIPRQGPWYVTIIVDQGGKSITFEDVLQAR
jgi:nitrogen fixation protein FixH